MNGKSKVVSVRTELSCGLYDTIIDFDDGGCDLRILEGDDMNTVVYALRHLAGYLEHVWIKKSEGVEPLKDGTRIEL